MRAYAPAAIWFLRAVALHHDPVKRMPSACAWFLATSIFLAAAGQGWAQEASVDDVAARREFGAGRDAYDRGSFGEALTHFERAHQLSPRPELLYNVGRAADSDGQWTRAISAYSSFLEAFPNSENTAFVEARLGKMRELELLSKHASTTTPAAQPSTPPLKNEPALAEGTALHPAVAQSAAHDDQRSPPFWKRAWFWSVVGVVVAGSATAAVLAARHDMPDRAAADVHVLTLVGR